MDMQTDGPEQDSSEPGQDGEVAGPPPGDDLPKEVYNWVPEIAKMAKTNDPDGLSGQDWLDKQGRRVIETTKDDEELREEFMKRRANQLKLYAGILNPLEYPAQGAKAPHLPILLQAMLSLWSRIWDQVCPAKGDIVHIEATGPEDEERALRVEKHMNWQVRTKMPDWASGLASSIMQWLLSGSMFRDYRWDPIEKCNVIDGVAIDDMVISYAEDDLHPLMPTIARKTRKRRLAKHVLLKFEEEGYYSGIKDLYDPNKNGQNSSALGNNDPTVVKETALRIDGIEKPTTAKHKDPDAKRELFERQEWLEIPGLDGLKPVKLTVDVQTKKIISLCLREVDDPVDAARFLQETAERQAIVQNLMMPPQVQPGMPPGPPPPPPQLPPEPKPIRQVPLYTTIHYRLFPNAEGFYGLGAGYLLESANDIVDGLLADVMVAGKFENLQMGFIATGSRTKRGSIEMVPGKFVEIDVQPEELAKAVMPFKFNPPSSSLVQLVEMITNKAESQAANQEILSGEQGGSRETAKSMQIRTGNAMQVVNVMTRLFIEPFKYEFKLMAHGNSVLMDDKEEFYVTTPSKTVPGVQEKTKYTVSRADYLEDYDITFTADSRVSSKDQRVGDAMGLLDKVVQTPPLAQGPTGSALIHLLASNVFKEMERPDFLAALGPPPQPPPPPEPMDQFDENAGFLNEKDHPVMPDDNHLEHIAKIQQFQESPYSKALSSTGKQMLDRHSRAHEAAHYQQVVKGANNGQPQQTNAPMGARPPGAGRVPPGRANGPVPSMAPGGNRPPAGAPPGQVPNGGPPGRPV